MNRRKKTIQKLAKYLLKEQESGGEGASNYEPPQPRITQAPDANDSLRERNASVDQKIDSYLFSFERDATAQGLAKKSAAATATIANDERPDLQTMQQVYEVGRTGGRKPVRMSDFLFLNEQQPEPAIVPDAPGSATGADSNSDPFGGADAGGDDPFADLGDSAGDDGSDAEGDGAGGSTVPVPKINVRKFAEGVARLAINYDTLLDPQSVILNRAMYYISKNYSPRLAKELVSILEQDFKLSAKSNIKGGENVYAMPFAGGSGPESGGVPAGTSTAGTNMPSG